MTLTVTLDDDELKLLNRILEQAAQMAHDCGDELDGAIPEQVDEDDLSPADHVHNLRVTFGFFEPPWVEE